ncbi:MAG: hypothetical protein V3R86_00365 [Candidatus Hydrothermarchaeaceae archaeon]
MGIIFLVLFWTVLILLIIWLYRQFKGAGEVRVSKYALDILKERYARG